MARLFHVSVWDKLSVLKEGETFCLQPGRQNAEGLGVYFSEGRESLAAADAIYNGGTHSATVVIEAKSSKGWWRSKKANLRRKGRPRTWHSAGKKVECQVIRREGHMLYCEWAFSEDCR